MKSIAGGGKGQVVLFAGLEGAAGEGEGLAAGIGAIGARVDSFVPGVGGTVVSCSGAGERGSTGWGVLGAGEGLAATGFGETGGTARTGAFVSNMAVGGGVGLPVVGGVVGAIVGGGSGGSVSRGTGAEVRRLTGASVGAATGGRVSGTVGAVVTVEVAKAVGANVLTPIVGRKVGAARGARVTPLSTTASISMPRHDDQLAGHSGPLVLAAATHWPYTMKALLAMQLNLGRDSWCRQQAILSGAQTPVPSPSSSSYRAIHFSHSG